MLLADRCERLGLSVPEITGATREKLEQCLPDFASARNPIDLTAQGGRDTSTWGKCLRALVDDPGIDVVLAQAFFREEVGMKVAEELVEICQSTPKLVVLMMHHRDDSEFVRKCIALVEGAGIPILADGLQAAEAVAKLCWYHEKVSRVRDAESRQPQILPGEGVDALIRSSDPLSEFQCKRILSCYGIPDHQRGSRHL